MVKLKTPVGSSAVRFYVTRLSMIIHPIYFRFLTYREELETLTRMQKIATSYLSELKESAKPRVILCTWKTKDKEAMFFSETAA